MTLADVWCCSWWEVASYSPAVCSRGGRRRGRVMSRLRQTSVFLGADPERGDDERIAETHHHYRKHKQNAQLVPGERDAAEVAVEVAIHARHDRHVAGVVVEQGLRCILCFIYTNILCVTVSSLTCMYTHESPVVIDIVPIFYPHPLPHI